MWQKGLEKLKVKLFDISLFKLIYKRYRYISRLYLTHILTDYAIRHTAWHPDIY